MSLYINSNTVTLSMSDYGKESP